jgi:hypothetical protein
MLYPTHGLTENVGMSDPGPCLVAMVTILFCFNMNTLTLISLRMAYISTMMKNVNIGNKNRFTIVFGVTQSSFISTFSATLVLFQVPLNTLPLYNIINRYVEKQPIKDIQAA